MKADMNNVILRGKKRSCGRVLAMGAVSLSVLGFQGASAQTAVDLTAVTTPPTYSAINGGYFFPVVPSQSAGSGTFAAIVRLQTDSGNPNPTEEGYNASARPVMPDVKTSLTFAHDFLVADLVSSTVNGVGYYVFGLDINQNQGALLSLDAFKLYTTANPLSSAGLAPSDPGSALYGLTPVFDMDAGENRSVIMKQVGSGSGKADFAVYVPQSAIDGSGAYLTLYTFMGGYGTFDSQTTGTQQGGFDEWGSGLGYDLQTGIVPPTIDPSPVPEASTTVAGLLVASVCAGTLVVRRRAVAKP